MDQAMILYNRGVRRFYIGGARGVDIFAGETIAALKKLSEYQGIELVCAIPFDGHDKKWNQEDCDRLAKLLISCDDIKIISVTHDLHTYKKRNYFMVDHSQILIAVYDDNSKHRSGTGQTVNYAKKQNREIIFIHPDTAAVSYFNMK